MLSNPGSHVALNQSKLYDSGKCCTHFSDKEPQAARGTLLSLKLRVVNLRKIRNLRERFLVFKLKILNAEISFGRLRMIDFEFQHLLDFNIFVLLISGVRLELLCVYFGGWHRYWAGILIIRGTQHGPQYSALQCHSVLFQTIASG